MRNSIFSVLALGALLVATGSSAEVYSWRDKSGKTVYGDRPPVDTQSAKTVDSVDDDGKGAASKGPSAKPDDDPRARVAQEDARRKKEQQALERQKKMVAWRCDEMTQQKAAAQAQYDKLVKSDPKKAAVLKTDIENYEETMDKMCE
jgi:hypothetical protein